MKNIDKLLQAYGVFCFLRRSLPSTQPDRNQTIKVMAETMTLIEKAIKIGMAGFGEKEAQIVMEKIYETSDTMMTEIQMSHSKVAGIESPLLQEVGTLIVIDKREEVDEPTTH